MDFDKKIEIILHVSGLTQEKLARSLNVSFPTVNSWVRGRSKPRRQKAAAIEALYSKVTGLTVAHDSAITAKKGVLSLKSKTHRHILTLLLTRRDLCDQLVLSLTYNTNRIEGSTLTEPETAAILFNNAALPNKTLTEQLEAKNHQTAFLRLLDWLDKKRPLNEDLILQLHGILMSGIQSNAGSYRQHAVRIVGSYVPTANYIRIPTLMKELVKLMKKSDSDVIAHVARVHSIFEKIHPFSDGNGRIGRLLMQAMLLKENYAPAVILQKRKRAYLSSLNASQLHDQFEALEEFICDAVILGLKTVTD